MLKLAITLLLSSLLLSSLTSAQDTATEAGRHFFEVVDSDSDGQLTRYELDAFLTILDTNRDGRISRHEFDVHMGEIDPLFADHQAHLYDRFDVNGDHHLDQDDFHLSFQANDLDKDGVVTYEEFLVGRTPPPPPG